MKEFSHILKELRNKKGLSQEALGRIINVSRSAIAKYENGLGLPSEDVINALCNYFNVDKDYLFPKENLEEIIVSKNKKIQFQKIAIVISACFVFLTAFIGLINIIPSPASSGGLEVINAKELEQTPTNQIKFFKYNEYEFGYKNIHKNDNNEFILKPGGELWSLDGMIDHLMGYYNGENTELYFYTHALNKVKVEYVSITSEGKYCYDTPEYKFGYNFVIINNTLDDINIRQLEFWC